MARCWVDDINDAQERAVERAARQRSAALVLADLSEADRELLEAVLDRARADSEIVEADRACTPDEAKACQAERDDIATVLGWLA